MVAWQSTSLLQGLEAIDVLPAEVFELTNSKFVDVSNCCPDFSDGFWHDGNDLSVTWGSQKNDVKRLFLQMILLVLTFQFRNIDLCALL